ncbi:MAG: 50S ribosome-binding GTPase [Candidatus Thermoplasmatota archaeon]|jgi:small GTP-binding protein|nr:50S ribosome-binding GTPase [Candidatus Thermoplasmatota archaeon]MCL5785372.1 50S ribosome-binding GTPase [Candidatus Thermoplasmatota archaeon]
MGSTENKIKEIEEELKKTQYNKATEHHIGMLKAKLSHLQMELEAHRKGGGGQGFSIPKSGDATVSLVGYPNVGKSSLLNSMTGAESEIGNFAFTTLRVIPGIMEYQGTKIQILDLPGIIENASAGSGRGREVLSVVRNSDLVLIVTDTEAKGIEGIISELYKVGIVLNRRKKNISVKKTNSGGIRIHAPRHIDVTEDTITSILKEFKITNADVYIRERITSDDVIDSLRPSSVFVPSIIVVNKTDVPYNREGMVSRIPSGMRFLEVSAKSGKGIEDLKGTVYNGLSLIRVYMREKSGETDTKRPLVMVDGSTVREAVRKISREMMESFRYAVLSGPKRKFREIRVGLDYPLNDGDMLTIISRN